MALRKISAAVDTAAKIFALSLKFGQRQFRNAQCDRGGLSAIKKPRGGEAAPGGYPHQQTLAIEFRLLRHNAQSLLKYLRPDGDRRRGSARSGLVNILAKSKPRSPIKPLGSMASHPEAAKSRILP